MRRGRVHVHVHGAKRAPSLDEVSNAEAFAAMQRMIGAALRALNSGDKVTAKKTLEQVGSGCLAIANKLP